jgi:hypothetical protein
LKFFKNNQSNGVSKTYYTNGVLKSEGFFKDDLLQGQVRIYSSDGTLLTTNDYIDGKLHGYVKNYSSTGIVTSSREFVEGFPIYTTREIEFMKLKTYMQISKQLTNLNYETTIMNNSLRSISNQILYK